MNQRQGEIPDHRRGTLGQADGVSRQASAHTSIDWLKVDRAVEVLLDDYARQGGNLDADQVRRTIDRRGLTAEAAAEVWRRLREELPGDVKLPLPIPATNPFAKLHIPENAKQIGTGSVIS